VARQLLAPADGAVIAPARDLPDVLARQGNGGRLGHRGVAVPQNVVAPLPEVVEHHGEPVLEQGAVEADVELLRDLPGDVRVGGPRLEDALHLGVAAEDVPAAESVRGEVLPGVDPVVPGLAPRAAPLEI